MSATRANALVPVGLNEAMLASSGTVRLFVAATPKDSNDLDANLPCDSC